MKKILFSVVCLMMVGIQNVKAQTPAAIMLMHQGNATMYSNQELTTAVSAAEAGDTIFLSNGTYSVLTGLTINKPISIIGAGQGTIVSGDITVDIDSTTTITGRLLDAIRMTHSLIVNQNPGSIVIRKCWISVDLMLNATAGNVVLDRCYARYFMPIEGFKKAFSATNSVISQYAENGNVSKTGNIIFTNCHLGSFYLNSLYNGNATFVNCLIGDLNSSASTNSYINCGSNSYTNSNTKGSFDNCYRLNTDIGNIFDTDSNNGFLTLKDSLAEAVAATRGTDGTIIGASGGSTPYTLIPSLPTVSESSFTVDDSNRTLNVTLKVTAE